MPWPTVVGMSNVDTTLYISSETVKWNVPSPPTVFLMTVMVPSSVELRPTVLAMSVTAVCAQEPAVNRGLVLHRNVGLSQYIPLKVRAWVKRYRPFNLPEDVGSCLLYTS